MSVQNYLLDQSTLFDLYIYIMGHGSYDHE